MNNFFANQRGQIAILMMLLLPLCLLLVALVADVAVLVVTKTQMQVTADQAALAAADTLAELMNQLAVKNWQIHHEFVAQKNEFTGAQQQSDAGGKTRLAHRQDVIDEYRRDMDDIVATGYAQARDAAQAVVDRFEPDAEMQTLYGDDTAPLFSFYDDYVDPAAEQWPRLSFTFPDGGTSWGNPASHQENGGQLLSYRAKAAGPDQQVAFAVRVRRHVLPGVGHQLLRRADPFAESTSDIWLAASAAAQPFGGDLYNAAMTDAANEKDIDAQLRDGQGYAATLVPMTLLQDREAGYRGLRISDENTKGWRDDDNEYLQ